MIYALRVPLTIEDNEAVRVLEWHGKPGDNFGLGQLVVEVETHKALVEISAGQPGVLREIRHGEGEWCPLGGVLGYFSDAVADEPGDAAADWPADFTIG
jgi:pyruvate/2-oxoglutarate dehydrogenase complex dihydrolipoamide acyltransferase (E2) component